MATISVSTRVALCVALGGFIFGFDASVISGVVPFISKLFGLSDWQIGAVVSAPTLGAVFSAMGVSTLADRFGRKPILISIAAIYAISAAYSALAPNFESLVIARFIGGLGFGSLVLAPIYISEIAPPHQRGRLVSFNQLNIVVGFSVAYFVNYFIVQAVSNAYSWAPPQSMANAPWRWMLGLELLPALAYIAMLFKIPESPRWLMLNNYSARATDVVKKLAGNNVNAEALLSEAELNQTHDLPPLSKRIGLLLSKRVRFALLLGLLLACAQQITGINAIYFYAPTIFEQSGVGTNAAFAQAALIGLINVLFTIVAMGLIDKVGRKPLLLIGLTGVAISMSLCAWEFKQAHYKIENTAIFEELNIPAPMNLVGVTFNSDTEFKQALRIELGDLAAKDYEAKLISNAIQFNAKLFLFGILLFVASFAVSLGPVMWVLLPEIFPNHLRGVGMALTGLVNSAVSFSVQFVFPWELSQLGAALTFFIYGAFALLGCILVARYLPETKGKSLEELEATFVRP
ncbi:sugar porter family MFS transporter [Saccharophagus degradans]|uniref:sugar porter family MFS transporter n=1 Tax=Saccharophagus degradans TaxID=86304 RepID=UPI001C08B251|nr:sugar porter family MFS transporter [Saccharophagus degradans]